MPRPVLSFLHLVALLLGPAAPLAAPLAAQCQDPPSPPGGFLLTEELSRECAVDLHALIELVERGCPPPLAARIMAPLDHERRAC